MTKSNTTEKSKTVSRRFGEAGKYLVNDAGFIQEVVRKALNLFMEWEMTEHLGAAKHERTRRWRGYRCGYYPRNVTMKVRTIELRVPQSREGPFSTQVFECYPRLEKAHLCDGVCRSCA